MVGDTVWNGRPPGSECQAVLPSEEGGDRNLSP